MFFLFLGGCCFVAIVASPACMALAASLACVFILGYPDAVYCTCMLFADCVVYFSFVEDIVDKKQQNDKEKTFARSSKEREGPWQ